MLTNKVCSRAIFLSLIATLSFLSCEKIGKESPTAVDDAVTNQPLEKSSLPKSLLSTPDIIVNTTSDVADFGGAQQVGDLPGPDGLVSLREAITAANNTTGPQVIGFNIQAIDPGFDGTVFIIHPDGDVLPALEDDGTTIDGMTQTGFTGNTNLPGPEIVLDGSLVGNVPGWENGLVIASSYNHINSVVIHSFGPNGEGIRIAFAGADHNRVTGCFIGTDHTGTIAKGNSRSAISIASGAANNVIGGTSTGEGNLLSGNHKSGIDIWKASDNLVQGNLIGIDATGTIPLPNTEWAGVGVHGGAKRNIIGGKIPGARNVISGNPTGISISGTGTESNVVQGNFVGTDPSGTNAIGNQTAGIEAVDGAFANVFGGPDPGDGNLVSGNSGDGVKLDGAAGNLVQGNFIGTDVTGRFPLPNYAGGVSVPGYFGPPLNNRIEENTIAYNREGITVTAGVNNSIRRNLIFSNEDLGIDLAPHFGVTPNDPGDTDTGSNNLMNFPVLTFAIATPGQLVVQGTIDTPNPQTVIIELFGNPVPMPGGDPSGHGEGAIFLGQKRPNRKGKFTAALPTVLPGTLISATATDADGNTSEFAENIEAKRPGN